MAIAVAIGVALTASTMLAYGSQVIYRLLEGYHLPRGVGRWMVVRQVRRRRKLAKIAELGSTNEAVRATPRYGLALEQLGGFPTDEQKTLPTRLGNALRRMEDYGLETFGLDSQEYWFELVGTAAPQVRQEQEEARALVDLFIAAVAASVLLAIASAAVGLAASARPPLILAGGALIFAQLAYRGSVRNMKEWRNSVRAMVNLGRPELASGLGMALPKTLEDEILMWRAVNGVYLHQSEDWKPWLDTFRRQVEPSRPSLK